MKCMYCGNEMTKGAIQSARMFFFTTKERKNWLTPYVGEGEEIVLSSHNWTNPACPAYHCAACKKIVISYSDDAE